MFPNCPTPPLKKYIKFKGGYLTKNFRACGVIDTPSTIFSFENQPYLAEFKAEFKKALARESVQGPRGYCLMKKTEGRKSRDTVPLNTIHFTLMPVFLEVLLY
jgi:hypothetical protein